MKTYHLKPYSKPGKLKINYKKELNPEQYQVVTQGNGPCLVLAGAGSGKTRTLVYRVAYLIEHGIKPNNILLVTFTNKAANEMLNRIEVLLKAKPKGLWGGTFHHIGNRILRIYGKYINISPGFNILDQEDSKSLIKACVDELDFKPDKYFPKAKVLKNIISFSLNLSQTIDKIVKDKYSYLKDKKTIPQIEQIADLYQQRKVKSNNLDFDDLLLKWNELLVKNPDIKARLANQFKYILVDEYQDTNHLQGEIISHLSGQDQNVLVVGDDSQSIYSFRGADINNILTFPKVFKKSRTFKLVTNYRSTPEILNLANQSIKKNKHQFKKTLKTIKKKYQKPILITAQDVDEQAEFVCQRILDLQKEHEVDLNKVAVLFRSHYQSLELEMAFNQRNIPYEMRGGLKFFEQAHIKDMIAYLRILANMYDELSWLRILRLQPGIGNVTANRLWQVIAKIPSLQKLLKQDLSQVLPPRTNNSWSAINQLFIKLIKINTQDISTIFKRILNSSYQDCLKTKYDNADDRLADIKQMIEYAAKYDSLQKFLADIALSGGLKGEAMAGYQEGPDEAVTLSTIHQAKGLEWQIVFLIGLIEGQFPHAKVFDKPQELEEERRLFYVATTRAEQELYLIHANLDNRGNYFNRPSTFIKELPKSVYEKWKIEEDEDDEDEEELPF